MKEAKVTEENIKNYAKKCNVLKEFVDAFSMNEISIVVNSFKKALFDVKPFGFKKVSYFDFEELKNIEEIKDENSNSESNIEDVKDDVVEIIPEKELVLEDITNYNSYEEDDCEIEYDYDDTAEMFETEETTYGWNEFDEIPYTMNFTEENKKLDNFDEKTMDTNTNPLKNSENNKQKIQNEEDKIKEIENEAKEWQEEKNNIDVAKILEEAINEQENPKKRKKRFSPLKEGIKKHSPEDFIKAVASEEELEDNIEEENVYSENFLDEIF